MNQDDVDKYARREPFRPFRLVLTGVILDVRQRDQIMLGEHFRGCRHLELAGGDDD